MFWNGGDDCDACCVDEQSRFVMVATIATLVTTVAVVLSISTMFCNDCDGCDRIL